MELLSLVSLCTTVFFLIFFNVFHNLLMNISLLLTDALHLQYASQHRGTQGVVFEGFQVLIYAGLLCGVFKSTASPGFPEVSVGSCGQN